MTTDIVKYEPGQLEPVNIYEFSENNSGGSWWLSKAQYDALHAAGFYYEPTERDIEAGYDKVGEGFGRISGPDVPYGYRHGTGVKAVDLRDAVERWERATGEDFFAEGCNCCGCPFTAYRVDGDGDRDYSESVSGDSVQRQTVRPW